MNTVFLIIWLKVNGINAMVQQPMDGATHCNVTGHGLILPAGSTWACGNEKTAAQAIYDGRCKLMATDGAMDKFICYRGK